jgi:hypothetical protein
MDDVTLAGVRMTHLAAQALEGVSHGNGTLTECMEANVRDDVQALRSGAVTSEELLARCLDGAEGEGDLETGWREYAWAITSAVEQAAGHSDSGRNAPRARALEEVDECWAFMTDRQGV